MKRSFGEDLTNTPKRTTVKVVNESRSDPRMNKAVRAKIADDSLSPVSALRLGGFIIPENATGKTIIDGTKLMERKNYLHKRIRWKINTPITSAEVHNKSRIDPRITKAVEAKIADDELSPESALRIGGFNIPEVSFGDTLIDGVTLQQRKNTFYRRLKKGKCTPITEAEKPNTPIVFHLPTYSSSSSTSSSVSEIILSPIQKKVRFNIPDSTPKPSTTTYKVNFYLPRDSSSSEEQSDESYDEYDDDGIDWDQIPNYSTTGSPEENPSILQEFIINKKKSSSPEESTSNIKLNDESLIKEHKQLLMFASSCIGPHNSIIYKEKFKLFSSTYCPIAYTTATAETLDNAILKYGCNSAYIMKKTNTGLSTTQIYSYVRRRKMNYVYNMIVEEYLGSKCCWCGVEASSPKFFEHDHCNESNKVIDLLDFRLSIHDFCYEVMKCRRLCKCCHLMRTIGQKKGKNQAFKMLPTEEQHRLRLEYFQSNIGISGFQLEGNVLTKHWIDIGHQSREKLTINNMKKDDRWTLISSTFGEDEAEVRVRTYCTFDGKTFSKKELEME
jgi:hypothetical protein